MKHLGSARDEQELEALLAAARQQLADSQQELDLGLAITPPPRSRTLLAWHRHRKRRLQRCQAQTEW